MELDLLPKLWTFFEDLDSCKQGERRDFSETTLVRAQACLYTLFNDGAVNNYNLPVKSFGAYIMNQQHLWTLRKLKHCLTEAKTLGQQSEESISVIGLALMRHNHTDEQVADLWTSIAHVHRPLQW